MATKRQSAAVAAAPAVVSAPVSPEPAAAPELIPVRVLATGAFGRIDSVVLLTPAEVAQGVASGQVDPHPDAVAYAASLK
jgi:hypothetical protein